MAKKLDETGEDTEGLGCQQERLTYSLYREHNVIF
jgi:hypothetical protein